MGVGAHGLSFFIVCRMQEQKTHLMIGMIPCLAVCTPVEHHCFAFGSFPPSLATGRVACGTPRDYCWRTASSALASIPLQNQEAWHDTTTGLHVMNGVV